MVKQFFIFISLLFTFNFSLAATNYCAAIRGNGELMPSHWGAMGHIVENWGMPKAMAGGSSASITIFLVESIAANKLLLELADGDEGKLRAYQSLLIKSMQGYAEFLASQKEIQEVQSLIQSRKFLEILNPLKAMSATSTSLEDMSQQIQRVLGYKSVLASTLGQLADKYGIIINREFLGLIRRAIDSINKLSLVKGDPLESQKIMSFLQFNLNEIRDAVILFGNFNAWTDSHLFFRPGIVDFKGLSQLLNRMANFFAGYGFDQNDKANLLTFLESCGELSVGRPWLGVDGLNSTDNNLCQGLFVKTLSEYREKLKSHNWKFEGNSRLDESVGKHLSGFISTSVVQGKSVKRFQELHKKYFEGLGFEMAQEIENFKVSFEKELFFGYWGRASSLTHVSHNLTSKDGFSVNGLHYNYSKDLKSQKFLSLGESPWSVALALSPAEPGLARIQFFPDNSNYLSAGGWSDLHPTLVLRAHGCENVIYVTRRDGESLFAQGSIHRLTDIQGVPADKLSSVDKGKYYNNIGDEYELSSEWSRLYNIAHPNSSYMLSVREADGVYCTNWNSFDIRKGWADIVNDGYRSPIYVGESSQLSLSVDNFKSISNEDNVLVLGGYRKFVGCIPLN